MSLQHAQLSSARERPKKHQRYESQANPHIRLLRLLQCFQHVVQRGTPIDRDVANFDIESCILHFPEHTLLEEGWIGHYISDLLGKIGFTKRASGDDLDELLNPGCFCRSLSPKSNGISALVCVVTLNGVSVGIRGRS